jgi:hypothetical protein
MKSTISDAPVKSPFTGNWEFRDLGPGEIENKKGISGVKIRDCFRLLFKEGYSRS